MIIHVKALLSLYMNSYLYVKGIKWLFSVTLKDRIKKRHFSGSDWQLRKWFQKCLSLLIQLFQNVSRHHKSSIKHTLNSTFSKNVPCLSLPFFYLSTFQSWVIVSVCLGCYKKNIIGWVALTTNIYF